MAERAYEYRFVAACGLERKYVDTGFTLSQQSGMLNGGPPPKQWLRVEGKDFLEMTWEELEHVAHVIRDASRPKTEGEAA
jgi:hypothetical protein